MTCQPAVKEREVGLDEMAYTEVPIEQLPEKQARLGKHRLA